MKRNLFLLTAIAIILATPAVATTVTWNVTPDGGSTVYDYILTSEETADLVTSLHIYAPTNSAAITSWNTQEGWQFVAEPDTESDGLDIYWYTDDPETYGLPSGQSLHFQYTTPSSIPTSYDYVAPDYLGNWGYETFDWAFYGVLVMSSSLPVPSGALTQAETPEPAGIAIIISGIAGMVFRRRRK